MSKQQIFGWDLLYKFNEKIIRNKKDVIICLVHWTLIHQGFHSVGVGEDTTLPNSDEYSEALPEGWNCSSNKYNLRYVHNEKLYILTAISNENTVIINLNRIFDNQATGICLNSDEVKEKKGSISKIIPRYNELIEAIEMELIQPMLNITPTREVQTQTYSENFQVSNGFQITQRPEPSRSESSVPVYRDIPIPARPLYADPLRDLGRSDLDPLAQPGGGMLVPPPGFGPNFAQPPGLESGMPPGSVPPGARYDPFRPPGREPRPPDPQNPDQDHLPPPGYDDMFM